MKLLNQIEIYQLILKIIDDKAAKGETYGYMISPSFGISASAYYKIKRFVNGENKKETELLSNVKLKKVCKNLDIEITNIFFEIKK